MLFGGTGTETDRQTGSDVTHSSHTPYGTRPDMTNKAVHQVSRPVPNDLDGGLIPPGRLDYFIGLYGRRAAGSDVVLVDLTE